MLERLELTVCVCVWCVLFRCGCVCWSALGADGMCGGISLLCVCGVCGGVGALGAHLSNFLCACARMRVCVCVWCVCVSAREKVVVGARRQAQAVAAGRDLERQRCTPLGEGGGERGLSAPGTTPPHRGGQFHAASQTAPLEVGRSSSQSASSGRPGRWNGRGGGGGEDELSLTANLSCEPPSPRSSPAWASDSSPCGA